MVAAAPAGGCCEHAHLMPPARGSGERPPLAIGDSVMLGAAPNLAAAGFEVDAKGGRVMRHALTMLRRRGARLPRMVVIALGTNVPVTSREIERALRILGRERVLGLVTPLRSWRPFGTGVMRRAARRHPRRVRLVDWASAASRHSNWLWGDGTHLRPVGARAYTRLIRPLRRAGSGSPRTSRDRTRTPGRR